MVNVDISNVWTCVSLPELLEQEREIFDAHVRMTEAEREGDGFMGWLRMPASAGERLASGIAQAARKICDQSDILLICGCGGAFHGTKAAIEAYCGAEYNLTRQPKILFVGQTLSTAQWKKLSRILRDQDYSLLLISPDGSALAPNVATRGLRWMMERRYGAEAKNRIYVATLVGTSMHTMAQEEGYELFPMPKQPGGFMSTLTSAAFLPMAVAGIDPQAVLEGAAESDRNLNIRSFENPAWLYSAARHLLMKKGRTVELLCVADEDLLAVGHWWQRTLWRQGAAIAAQAALLPGDLEAFDRMAAGSKMFETMLHFEKSATKVPVEMDWKDYDGLGFLSGKTVDQVESSLLQAVVQTHNDAGVPVFDVDAGELTAENLGAMLHFFELSAALCALMDQKDPFNAAAPAARQMALADLGGC